MTGDGSLIPDDEISSTESPIRLPRLPTLARWGGLAKLPAPKRGALQSRSREDAQDAHAPSLEHLEIVKAVHQENDNAKEPLKGLALWSKVVGAEEVKE